MNRKTIMIAAGIGALALLAGCTDADTVSHNISKAADQFEVQRRIVFYNGITGEYMLVMEGLCSLGNFDSSTRLSVTCKTGPNQFKKNFLGLSDNVTFFAEQMEPVKANAYHYRVILKPQALIPDFDLKVNGGALTDALSVQQK